VAKLPGGGLRERSGEAPAPDPATEAASRLGGGRSTGAAGPTEGVPRDAARAPGGFMGQL